ncbi:hypothetical protein [Acuticoccus sp.]|uniref:hypothetical protein n=1 Tax=Acuticoccus sp. TaxID=1904378 RepID=UPI003B521EBF
MTFSDRATARAFAAAPAERVLVASAAIAVFAVWNDVKLGEFGGLTLYLGELVIWALLAPQLALSLLVPRTDAVTLAVRWFPEVFVYTTACAFAAAIALGYAGSPDTAGKVKNLLPSVVLATFLLFAIRSRTSLVLVLMVIVAAGVLNAVLGLVQFRTGALYLVPPLEENVWKEGLSGDLLERTANGLFATPNGLGVGLLPAVVIAARLIVDRDALPGRLRLAVLGPAIFVLTAALYASANKGALIWSLVGLAVAFAPIRRKGTLTLASLAVVSGALMLVGGSDSRVLADLSTGTIRVRVLLLEAFGANVAANPSILVYGNGEATMEPFAARIANWRFSTTHNTWVDQLLMFGVPGFAAYVWMWGAQLALAVRGRATARAFRGVADALLGCVAGLAGAIFFEPRADGVFSTGQVLVLFALATAQVRLARAERALAADRRAAT